MANDVKIGSQLRSEDTQSTQAGQTQKRGSSSGLYVLRSIIKEQYRTTDIITRSEDEYSSTGLLYIILGLIFLGGQTMISRKVKTQYDNVSVHWRFILADLYGHLDRLKITKRNDRDKRIEKFIKTGYLRRSKIKDIQGDEQEYTYTWGPRAAVELGHAGVVEFLLSVNIKRAS